MKILLIGPQGSGKGTIGELLSTKLNLPYVSLGQVLRDLPKDHKYKKDIDAAMHKGVLAPIFETGQILKEELKKDIYKNGFIADGWGRQLVDLQMYDPGFDKVIYLHISTETSVKRLSNRRVCKICGRNYNIVTLPPKQKDICDLDGGDLYQREDDTPFAIQARLLIFNTKTQEVLDYFDKKGNLISIDGEPAPKEVISDILQKLNYEKRN